MRRREWLAILALILIMVGMPLAVVGYQYGLRRDLSSTRVIDITAAVPEAGGFQPSAIKVDANETVTLRFSSIDVTHGIAIGPGLDIDLGHVDPGHVKEVTLTFEQPGTYTFYCNAWCSPDHWRMRGVVEVVDPANPNWYPAPQHDPVIEALIEAGVNIDADHMEMAGEAHETLHFENLPSAERGAVLAPTFTIPPEIENLDWRRSHAPLDALEVLEEANPAALQSDLVDVLAYLWMQHTTPDRLLAGQTLYEKNCAACHGMNGNANGPAASLTATYPVAFADVGRSFTMRSDVWYAKIRRGGMGTDMPNFGTLFTPEETWLLVDYLYSFGMNPAR